MSWWISHNGIDHGHGDESYHRHMLVYKTEESTMTQEEQVEIMEAQLSNFDNLMDKMGYMSMAFDADPEFTQAARDIVRSNICMSL